MYVLEQVIDGKRYTLTAPMSKADAYLARKQRESGEFAPPVRGLLVRPV